MRLFITVLSFGLAAAYSHAQEGQSQDVGEAEKSVEERIVVTGSRLTRREFTRLKPSSPKPLIESDLFTPEILKGALEDPDTRIFALNENNNAYREIKTERELAALSPDQIDNLRFLTNPIARTPDRTIVTVDADDILNRQEPEPPANEEQN